MHVCSSSMQAHTSAWSEIAKVQEAPNTTSVAVTVPGKGAALFASGLNFAYARRWSDTTGWPGAQQPSEADDVLIAEDESVLLDVSPPPLGLLHIRGRLFFDDAPVRTLGCSASLCCQAAWLQAAHKPAAAGTAADCQPHLPRWAVRSASHGHPRLALCPHSGHRLCAGT